MWGNEAYLGYEETDGKLVDISISLIKLNSVEQQKGYLWICSSIL